MASPAGWEVSRSNIIEAHFSFSEPSKRVRLKEVQKNFTWSPESQVIAREAFVFLADVC